MEYNHLEYVRKYFKLFYGTYYNRLSKNEVDSLCLEISKLIRNKYNDFKLVQNGVADRFISVFINSYVNEKDPELRVNYINLRNYVTNYVKDSCFINYSIKTLDAICENISDMLIPTYSFNRMNDGLMDDEIMSSYNFVLSSFCNEIRKYVSSFISNNIVPLNDINNVEVEDIIIKMALNTTNINFFDLLLGRQDSKIKEEAIKNREKNRSKRLAEMPDTIEYIKNIAEIYTDDMELVNKIANRVDMDLRDEGLTPKQIVSKKYDMKIRKKFNDYYSKSRNLLVLENSVENDNVPDKIEKVGRKVNINKVISQLLVASAILGLISYGGYKLGQDIRADRAEDNLNNFDSHSYSLITSIYDVDLKPTVKNLIETFDDYRLFDNDNFSYLGFYRAYRSVDSHKLHIMDNILSQIKKDIHGNKGYDNLRSCLNTNGCYLDFIYDRLYSMGFEEIKEDKYTDLLYAYVDAKNKDKFDDPVELLSFSQKMLLNKVLDMYEDYSEQYLLEFGVLLGKQNVNSETTSSVRRS